MKGNGILVHGQANLLSLLSSYFVNKFSLDISAKELSICQHITLEIKFWKWLLEVILNI